MSNIQQAIEALESAFDAEALVVGQLEQEGEHDVDRSRLEALSVGIRALRLCRKLANTNEASKHCGALSQKGGTLVNDLVYLRLSMRHRSKILRLLDQITAEFRQ